jgi:hypothetical protein
MDTSVEGNDGGVQLPANTNGSVMNSGAVGTSRFALGWGF